MEERVSFDSDGLRLAGVLHVPDDGARDERRPAVLVLHGFGSNKDSGGSVTTAKMLAGYGYAALRFDMRGCGESEGPRGRVICLEQVQDTRSALTFLAKRTGIDPDGSLRIEVFANRSGRIAADAEPTGAAGRDGSLSIGEGVSRTPGLRGQGRGL